MHMSMSQRMIVCPLYVWILVMEVRDEVKPTGQLRLCCVVGRCDAYAMLLRMSVFPLYVWMLLMEVRDEVKLATSTAAGLALVTCCSLSVGRSLFL